MAQKRQAFFCVVASMVWMWLSVCGSVQAALLTIPGPFDSVSFGTSVTWLPNGNLVVTDPNAGPSAVGAVYLYRPDGSLISTLKGGSANDNVGSGGTRVLPGGNFLVISPSWRNGANASAGAVTFVNASTGLSGTVSALNSLVGIGNLDSSNRQVVVLNSGHYLVHSPLADLPGLVNGGAITWGNGQVGVSGEISASNSLVSPNAAGFNGLSLAELTNGNFVLGLPLWNQVGAAVWCPGQSGCIGQVESNIALTGTTTSDLIGSRVTPLSNGHYVVSSTNWDGPAGANQGAVTWANGVTGLAGTVSSANSWIGSSPSDNISDGGVTALSNGNFVIASRSWANAGAVRAGAVTWVDGTGSSSGVVGPGNSMIGTQQDDGVGSIIVALSNGNYVVGAPNWNNPSAVAVGAARWGNGQVSTIGPLSSANAVVGTVAGDLANLQIETLPSGNYLLRAGTWDNGLATDAGAAVWGNGQTGTTGIVSAAIALVGTTSGDQIGTAYKLLTNGNLLVGSGSWTNGSIAGAGLLAFMNGSTGGTGVVSGSNAIIGTSTNDGVGLFSVALTNGNYLVLSHSWDGTAANIGAVTWGNGTTGTSGPVSTTNSVVGGSFNDGSSPIPALLTSKGDAVIAMSGFDVPGRTDAGMMSLVKGNGPSSAVLTTSNAYVGGSASEFMGTGVGTTVTPDDRLVIVSSNWDTGVAPLNVGAICLLDATVPISGQSGDSSCITGTVANQGSSLKAAYSTLRQQLAVGKPAENVVVLFDFRIFADSFE